jgi:hypothetical protein
MATDPTQNPYKYSTTIGGGIGQTLGEGIGLAASGGNPVIADAAGKVGEFIGNTAGQIGAEFTPAAKAQRAEARKAAQKLRTGEFGTSATEKQNSYAQAQKLLQAQSANMQQDVARQQAAGNLSGGAYSDAVRNLAQQTQGALGNVAGQIQQSSDRMAQSNYQQALGLVDAQADRGREFWTRPTERPPTTQELLNPKNYDDTNNAMDTH